MFDRYRVKQAVFKMWPVLVWFVGIYNDDNDMTILLKEMFIWTGWISFFSSFSWVVNSVILIGCIWRMSLQTFFFPFTSRLWNSLPVECFPGVRIHSISGAELINVSHFFHQLFRTLFLYSCNTMCSSSWKALHRLNTMLLRGRNWNFLKETEFVGTSVDLGFWALFMLLSYILDNILY